MSRACQLTCANSSRPVVNPTRRNLNAASDNFLQRKLSDIHHENISFPKRMSVAYFRSSRRPWPTAASFISWPSSTEPMGFDWSCPSATKVTTETATRGGQSAIRTSNRSLCVVALGGESRCDSFSPGTVSTMTEFYRLPMLTSGNTSGLERLTCRMRMEGYPLSSSW